MKEDMQRQLEELVKYLFRECSKNEVIYGMFALDSEIPQEIKDNSWQMHC